MADMALDRMDPTQLALERASIPSPGSLAPTTAKASPADQLMEQFAASQKRTQGIVEQEEREKAPLINEALAANRQPGPAPPKLGRETEPPKSNIQQQMQEWLMPMVALSAIAGAFSRQHATTALNAFAAGMQGIKEGNLTLYKQKTDEWKAANEKLIANNEAALKEYNAVWNNRKLNIDQKMNEIALISSKYQDRLTYEAASQKNFTLVAQMLQKQEHLQDQLTLQYEKLKAQNELSAAKMEKLASDMEKADPFVMSQRLDAIQDPAERKRVETMIKTLHPQGGILFGDAEGEQGLAGFSNAALDARAKMWAEGNQDGAFKGVGGGALGSRLRNMISTKGAELAQAGGTDVSQAQIDYKARQAGASSGARAEGTREANLNIILRATDAAIPAALEASEKVNRTGFVPLNRIIQNGQVMTSDPALRQFGMANLQLAEHWARAMNPTGVMREGDRDLALGFLSTADSKETYKSLVMQLRKQIERERAAVVGGKTHSGASPVPGGPAPSEGGGAAAAPSGGGSGGVSGMSDDDLKKKLGLQ